MSNFLYQVREWLSVIILPSLVFATLTLAARLAIRKSASFRMAITLCGLVALTIVALAPLVPLRFGMLKETPKWMPTQAPASLTQTPIPDSADVSNLSTSAPVQEPSLDWVTLAYACIASALIVRMFGGIAGATWLKLKAQPFQSEPPLPLAGLSDQISVPLAIGGIRPMILFPEEAQMWPASDVRDVYLHEKAHLKNQDWLWQTLANAVAILHWFNPAVWLINRGLRADMERLADDAVLGFGVTPSSYASTLVRLAQSRQTANAGVLGSAFGRHQGLQARVQAILDESQSRKPLSKKRVVLSLALTALAVEGISAVALVEPADQGIMADVQGSPSPAKSTPATLSNGFKGKLDDGRTIEVLQVTQFDRNGKQESWLPNGQRIPANKAVALAPLKGKPWIKAMLIRYPALDNSSGFDLSIWTLWRNGAPVGYLNFSGGKLLPIQKGYRYGICYFGLPKPTQDFSFRVVIQDAPQQTAFVWKADDTTQTVMPGISELKVDEIQSSDLGFESQYWMQGYKGPVTRIRFKNDFGPAWTIINNFSRTGPWDKDLRTHTTDLRSHRVTYLMEPKANLKQFAINVARQFSCDLLNVRTKPNP